MPTKTTKRTKRTKTPVIEKALSALERAAGFASTTGKAYRVVEKGGTEYVLLSALSRVPEIDATLTVLPAFGKDGKNPRRGAPLRTHGGIAFEVLRDTCKALGSDTVPAIAYLAKLSDPNIYPGASAAIGTPDFFRAMRHLRCDIDRRIVAVS